MLAEHGRDASFHIDYRHLLPTAPIPMTLAAGYPHRPLQFSNWGWLPVPEGMVFEVRLFDIVLAD